MSVFEQHPLVLDLRARQRALAEAEAAKAAVIEPKVAKYNAALADWEQKCAALALSGKPVPPKPQPPDLGDDEFYRLTFMNANAAVEDELRSLRCRLAPDLVPDIDAAVDELDAEMEAHLAVWVEGTRRRNEFTSERDSLRAAAGWRGPSSSMTPAEYLHLVAHRHDDVVQPESRAEPVQVDPTSDLGMRTNLPKGKNPYDEQRRRNLPGARL